jgi:uncharacterized Tic20 family protein
MIESIDSDTISPTSDERMLAALAHFFGLFGALIIYVFQKGKSRFVRFQAAQALSFELITMMSTFVLFFGLFGVIFVGIVGTMFAGLNSASSSEDLSRLIVFPALFPFGLFTCVFPFMVTLFIVRIVAMISVLNGNNFRYPWLGTRVESFLGDLK